MIKYNIQPLVMLAPPRIIIWQLKRDALPKLVESQLLCTLSGKILDSVEVMSPVDWVQKSAIHRNKDNKAATISLMISKDAPCGQIEIPIKVVSRIGNAESELMRILTIGGEIDGQLKADPEVLTNISEGDEGDVEILGLDKDVEIRVSEVSTSPERSLEINKTTDSKWRFKNISHGKPAAHGSLIFTESKSNKALISVPFYVLSSLN